MQMALSNLTQNLTFPNYKRIETSRDSKEVGDAVGGGEVEQGTTEDGGRDLGMAGEEFCYGWRGEGKAGLE